MRALFALLIVLAASLLNVSACSPGNIQHNPAPVAAASINQSTRLWRADLQALLPGLTVYGQYLDSQSGTWVERYVDDGSYWTQSSAPGFETIFVTGNWVIEGDLVCYLYVDQGLAPACVQIYERDRQLEFVDASTLRVFAVSTAVEFSRATEGAALAPAETSPQAQGESSGSGFYVNRDGFILTNYHVIEYCSSIAVSFKGAVQAATITAIDPDNDLAVLRSSSPAPAVAAFSMSGTAEAGEQVIAVGFPLAGLLSSEANIAIGSVSATAGIGDDLRFLQVTTPIQPGNSGGPLLDMSGNVVGVVVSKLDSLMLAAITGDIPQNVNFAVKAGYARQLLSRRGVEFSERRSDHFLNGQSIARLAKEFTVLITCRT